MKETEKIFRAKAAIKSADIDHRKKINSNIDQYNDAVPEAKKQFGNLPLARQKAKNIKWLAIENLDKNLEQFEQKIIARGAKVIWARDAAEANKEILKICKEKNCASVVKSKSLVSEEILLNDFLMKNDIQITETGLGEFIQQLDEEPPYHMMSPAIHKSKEEIAKLFNENLEIPSKLPPEKLALAARQKLRKEFTSAPIGITGAEFIISDIGGIAVSENEGNIRLTAAFPKTHIVLASIDKMISSINDISLMWPLFSTYGNGRQSSVYNNIFTGPRQPNETDGPEDMYVILLDNNRTRLLADTTFRESLYCINCGACLSACPVYKNIGGHAYGTTYNGPIGSVISPQMNGLAEYKHLSFASSICGACTEACPVNINIHNLLLQNRNESVKKGSESFSEKLTWKTWKVLSLKRSAMNKGSSSLKNKIFNSLFKNWQHHHTPLEFSKKTFNEMWKDVRLGK